MSAAPAAPAPGWAALIWFFAILILPAGGKAAAQQVNPPAKNTRLFASRDILPRLHKTGGDNKPIQNSTSQKKKSSGQPSSLQHSNASATVAKNGPLHQTSGGNKVPAKLVSSSKQDQDKLIQNPSSGNLLESSPASGKAEAEDGDDDSKEDEEDSGPIRLLAFPAIRARGIEVDGWLGQGFTWNPDRPADRFNGPNGMNDRSNDYQFNQLGLAIYKELPDERSGRALGWRVDMMYGSDSRFVQSLGFDDSWNYGSQSSLAIPQIFADLHLPDVNPWGDGAVLRVGRFWSPIGYEGVPAMDRFFYSATHAFMLAQPSTHTGATLTLPIGSNWTAMGGIVQGWDVWRDNNNTKAFLGTLGWINDEETTTVTHVLYHGNQSDTVNDEQTTWELILTQKLNERLNYIGWFDFNFAQRIGTNSAGDPSNAQWFSLNQALLFAINDQWSAGTRLEWFHDDDGVRILHPAVDDPLGAGDLFGLTFGLNHTPTKNWLIRPEVRWDWASGVRPFDDRTSSKQATAAIDFVVQF